MQKEAIAIILLLLFIGVAVFMVVKDIKKTTQVTKKPKGGGRVSYPKKERNL